MTQARRYGLCIRQVARGGANVGSFREFCNSASGRSRVASGSPDLTPVEPIYNARQTPILISLAAHYQYWRGDVRLLGTICSPQVETLNCLPVNPGRISLAKALSPCY